MNAETTTVPKIKTNRLAVTSLVLGILSLVLCVVGILFAVPGLICGLMGMKRVKNSGGTQKGQGLAVAGTVLSVAGLVMFPVIALLAAIAVPNFIKAREVAMRNGCVANLRKIDSAKLAWASDHNNQVGDPGPSLADLLAAGKYLQQKPVCPAGGTYSVNRIGTEPSCSVPEHHF